MGLPCLFLDNNPPECYNLINHTNTAGPYCRAVF